MILVPLHRGERSLWPIAVLLALGLAAPVQAQPAPAPGPVPARLLPVPDTVSADMRGLIGALLPPDWDVIPQT